MLLPASQVVDTLQKTKMVNGNFTIFNRKYILDWKWIFHLYVNFFGDVLASNLHIFKRCHDLKVRGVYRFFWWVRAPMIFIKVMKSSIVLHLVNLAKKYSDVFPLHATHIQQKYQTSSARCAPWALALFSPGPWCLGRSTGLWKLFSLRFCREQAVLILKSSRASYALPGILKELGRSLGGGVWKLLMVTSGIGRLIHQQ